MQNNKQKFGDLGQHWTPEKIVETMVSLIKFGETILEPSAGSGRFMRKLPSAVGLEIDPTVIPADLVGRFQVVNFFNFPTTQKFSTVIGNPPYVAGKLLPNDWFGDWIGVSPKTANAYIHFIEKCIHHTTEQSEIIMIVPATIFGDSSRGGTLRNMMLNLGSFTDVLTFEQNVWDEALVDTVIFRWERGIKSNKIRFNGTELNLIERNNFIWFLDYVPEFYVSDFFKVTVGSAPSANAYHNGDVVYVKGGKEILLSEKEMELWPRVHHTPPGMKILFNSGPTRRWPVFSVSDSGKHVDHALIPLIPFESLSVVCGELNEYFKLCGEELGLIKSGRWNVGVKQLTNCPIPSEIISKFR